MILLQRYIFKELLYNFIFAFVVISAVVLLASLFQVLYKYPMLGLDMLVTLVPFMILAIMSIVLPAAVLVSVVTTYGRMSADNEITTLKASGVHVFRVAVPGVLFGLLASLALLVVNDRFVPTANRRIKSLGSQQDILSLLDNLLKRGRTTLNLDNLILTWESSEMGETAGGEEAWVFKKCRARRYDSDGKLEQELLAERAMAVPSKTSRRSIDFVLEEVTVVGSGGVKLRKAVIPYELDTGAFTVRLGHRSLAALLAMLRKEQRPYPPVRILTEIHNRIAQSLSPLIFVFLGLPVALLFRTRNRLVTFLISVLVAIFVYYPVTFLGATFADKGVLHPALCIWPGNLILLAGGVFFFVRLARR